MARITDCPKLEELERYASGELEDATRGAIETHVAECDACNTLLDDVAENLSVARQLRDLPPLPAAEQVVTGRRIPISEQIGRYRILRKIGQGGMGVVYDAEQDNPRRTVALKLIQPEFISPSALRRFEHETQVLGRLQHPGIAQIYEAGTADTESGQQPFFAMELVHGVNLRDFFEAIDTRSLGEGTIFSGRSATEKRPVSKLECRKRLAMIAKICDAVQYAHQRGVIHRDLKPSNVLVDDRHLPTDSSALSTTRGNLGRPEPLPKILDFGVARVTDSDIQTSTLQTNVGQLVGTVPYMSPEQVAGDRDQLDTRSDIYSLGVTAYEVLSGQLPYDLTSLSIPEAARVIRDEDPTPLASIDRAFRGDIETIVGKALEKDPVRRYQSAAELAADIRRYLNDEPIAARPPSAVYQLRKFARRNRALVSAGFCIAVILVVGAAVSIWQAIRATEAEGSARARLKLAEEATALAEANEDRATREATKFKVIGDFLHEMLGAANPENVPEASEFTVRDAVGRAASKLDEGMFADQPEVEAAVRTTVGNTFRAVGDFEAAEKQLQRAVQLGRSLTPKGSQNLAHMLNKLARLLDEKGRYDEAERIYREALAMRRQLLGEEHEHVATIMNNLGWLLAAKGEYEEGEQLLRETLAMRRRLLGNEHSEVATTLNNLALLLEDIGQSDEAVEMFRRSLAIDQKLRTAQHPNIAATMTNLVNLLTNQGELDEAESLLRKALTMQREMYGDESHHVATVLNNLARLTVRKGDSNRAEELYRQSLAMNRTLRGQQHPEVATVLHNLAWVLVNRGENDEAEKLFQEALDIRRKVLGEKHPQTLGALFSLAQVLQNGKEYARAEPLLEEASRHAKEALPKGHWMTGAFLRGYGECLTNLSRYEEAERPLLEAHSIFQATYGSDHRGTTSAARALSALYEAWNKPAEATTWRAKMAIVESPNNTANSSSD